MDTKIVLDTGNSSDRYTSAYEIIKFCTSISWSRINYFKFFELEDIEPWYEDCLEKCEITWKIIYKTIFVKNEEVFNKYKEMNAEEFFKLNDWEDSM